MKENPLKCKWTETITFSLRYHQDPYGLLAQARDILF